MLAEPFLVQNIYTKSLGVVKKSWLPGPWHKALQFLLAAYQMGILPRGGGEGLTNLKNDK